MQLITMNGTATMTLDDLTNTFIKFCYSLDDADSLSSNERATIRAGIRAVVLALADDMYCAEDMCKLEDIANAACKKSLQVVKDRLTTEILASDGVDKAEYTGGMNDLCVTPAAAPDVCEWTPKRAGSDMHHTACEKIIWRCDEHAGICPSCGKPISFKEGSE